MSDTQTPLWKQLLGAGTGALVALAAYVAYDAAAPALTAVLASPGGTIIRPAEPVTPSSEAMHEAATPEQEKMQADIANKAKALTDSFKGSTVTPDDGTDAVAATSGGSSSSEEATIVNDDATVTEPVAGTTMETSSEATTVIAGTRSGKLPNSGIGVWVGIFGAFSIALGLHLRRHAKVA